MVESTKISRDKGILQLHVADPCSENLAMSGGGGKKNIGVEWSLLLCV